MKQLNRVRDLSGQKFGRLTAIRIDDRGTKGKTYWICECECGNIKSVRSDSLVGGRIRSCGCLHSEAARRNVVKNHKHKMSGTRLYCIWQNMKSRCYNENDVRWARYGGRGIRVCDEWKNDFQSFYDWAVENGYSEDLTIDRIDNDGNYFPENCRWTTAKEQARNRSTNIDVTIGNATKTLTEWCDIFQIDYKAAFVRYRRNEDCTLEGLFNAVGK